MQSNKAHDDGRIDYVGIYQMGLILRLGGPGRLPRGSDISGVQITTLLPLSFQDPVPFAQNTTLHFQLGVSHTVVIPHSYVTPRVAFLNLPLGFTPQTHASIVISTFMKVK